VPRLSQVEACPGRAGGLRAGMTRSRPEGLALSRLPAVLLPSLPAARGRNWKCDSASQWASVSQALPVTASVTVESQRAAIP
jgi:hypothetical protein